MTLAQDKPLTQLVRAAARATATFPTLAELKEMLGIPPGDTTQDEEIVANMAATIAIVEAYLGRGVAFATETQTFEPVDTRNPKLMLFRFPVSEVTTVTVDGAALTGWRVLKASGILEWFGVYGARFPHYTYNEAPVVEVAYSGGYPDDAFPPDLLDAILRAFSARWNATGKTGNVSDMSTGGPIKSVSVDGLAVSYGDLSASSQDFTGGPVPPELAGVVAMLEPYRQRFLTGV